jgi:short-subunit dehydrogenase
MGYALITGASAGLGVDFAKLFANDGHSLILVARRLERMEELAKEITAQHPSIKVEIIDMDLAVAGAGQTLFDEVQRRGHFVEFLVNNAGFGSNGSFAKLPLSKELQMIDLNIRTLVEATHLFLQPMLQKRSGFVLNIGSTAGFQPGPFMATYYASKAFVNSFSEALSEELRGTGVSCTILAPGATATEFAKSASVEDKKLFKAQAPASSASVARTGYEAMMNRRTLSIAGFTNKLLPQALRFSPRFLVRRITATLNNT